MAEPSLAPLQRLIELFRLNGYARVPREERLLEGAAKYKKGWEVRLVFSRESELDEARRLLRQSGIKAGMPFRKGKQWVQPIYGKHAVKAFVNGDPADSTGDA